MGTYIYRPQYAADYGQVETVGSGVVLGDNNDATFKRYYENSGSILTYPVFPANGAVPAGRDIIAVRAGLRQRNTGFLGLYNGWVMGFLRIDDKKQSQTQVYRQDGYNDGGREILGQPYYNKNLDPWTPELLSTMGTEVGAAVGEIGPSNNRWCVCSESYIVVVYEDPVPVPVMSYPANGQSISTSSVSFTARTNTTQTEQPVSAVFQVARDNTFTLDVRTYVGGLNQSTDAASTSNYVSVIGKDSYTDLGPGTWYIRTKGRDFRNKESAWGATTQFTISHAALPVPTISSPLNGATVASPYAQRSAVIAAQPSGDRYVGVEFQFSKASDFSSGVISWANVKDGIYFASSSDPKTISYSPKPDSSVAAGQRSGKVGIEDPSQYLSQGTWYVRVRAIDKYLQTGSFSPTTSFAVSHPPVPTGIFPSGGASFDQDETQVSWTFTDPWTDDYQSAYQMTVQDPSNNIIQDTGKVNSSTQRAKMNIPATWLNTSNLKVNVRIWDSDGVASSSSVITGAFRLVKAPIITLTYPAADAAIISGQPNLQWSCVFSRAGLTQKSFRAKFTRTDNGNVEFDSGVITSTDTSYLPPTPILKNLSGYQLSFTVTDSENVSKTILRNFSTNFERPANVISNADTSTYLEKGYATVEWVNTNPDAFFMEWRVYRRPSDEKFYGQWELAGSVADPSVKSFNDWLVAGSGLFKYCVVQAAYRFGSIVEGAYDENADDVYIQGDSYWLICPEDSSLNVKLYIVDEKFTINKEVKDQTIKNRGRIVIYGTNIGRSGNLSCQVRHSDGVSATEKLEMIDAIADNNFEVLLKDPFGNVIKIGIGEIGVSRIAGVGVSEFADLDIPYWEVM